MPLEARKPLADQTLVYVCLYTAPIVLQDLLNELALESSGTPPEN